MILPTTSVTARRYLAGRMRVRDQFNITHLYPAPHLIHRGAFLVHHRTPLTCFICAIHAYTRNS